MTRTSWIGKASGGETPQPARVQTQRGASFPTVVRARGIAPANAFIDAMSDEECVIRCVMLFDTDSPIEFDAKRADGTAYVVRGRIRSRVSVPPRFEYTVDLERSVPVVANPKEPEARERRSLRLDVEFGLQYRTAKEGFKNAKARNVSTGGLLMTCRETLVETMMLELHFVLPSHVLNVYPERTTVLDIRAGFKRKSVPSKRRKPFGDLVVPARIVRHHPVGQGQFAYGISFFNMDRHAREEIARFVEAVRHVKVRQKP